MGVATTGRRLDRFLTDLSSLVESLPSADVKAKLDADLASLIEFLEQLRTTLKSLPTDGGADQIAATIEHVKDFVRIAEADPTMCRLLGLSERKQTDGRPRRRPRVAGDFDAAKALGELHKMPSQEIERTLTDRKTYTVAALRAIASQLGLRIPSKATRLSVAERITKAVSNRRGYQYLREGGPLPLVDSGRDDNPRAAGLRVDGCTPAKPRKRDTQAVSTRSTGALGA